MPTKLEIALRVSRPLGYCRPRCREPSREPIGFTNMKYRDVQYAIVQSIDRGVWKWSASVADVVIMGREAIKSEAVTAAERAIDRALAPKKIRLVPPQVE
jgi:hypothetical protein